MSACPNCKPPTHHPRQHFQPVLLTIGVILATLSFAGVGVLRDTVLHLQTAVSSLSSSPNTTAQSLAPGTCDYPVVYNKPHKTASTKIQADILAWAQSVGRPGYKCSPYTATASMQMRECIPDDHSGCAVIATHFIMSPVLRQILENKIGKFRLVTSTRDPTSRIVSGYLQIFGKQGADLNSNSTHLLEWLHTRNPWKLYNYHTGENRIGRCPLTLREKALIPDMVNAADIVIDLDLFDASQAILKANRLFQLTNTSVNVRSTSSFHRTPQIDRALKQVSCVEDEIHRLYRLRMASLYERATNKRCLIHYHGGTPTTCFDD